jgi:hypothetical protein
MSHLKERTEKDCLNCGATVTGRFCHHCGQENVEVKESFGHLIMHFIEDLTHFDGKLWVTLKLLLFKPAKLTQYYMEGKRATYIHPIRMYLFISAVFFFFIFSGKSPEPIKGIEVQKEFAKNLPKQPLKKEGFKINLSDDTVQYKTISAYDTAQSKLSKDKRDSWLESSIIKKSIEINTKYNDDKNKIGQALIEQFQHYFSRMLYISLPVFALFLWVLYRRNKNHYFVDHLIFSIHIYCAFFIILFALKLVNLFTEYAFNKIYYLATTATPFILFFYLYKALRNHFNQSRAKTFFKFMILNFLTLVLMAILMLSFILLSLFNI